MHTNPSAIFFLTEFVNLVFSIIKLKIFKSPNINIRVVGGGRRREKSFLRAVTNLNREAQRTWRVKRSQSIKTSFNTREANT